MASLGMSGPYTLDAKTIDKFVTNASAGNYALGHTNSKGTFIPRYVGRSDKDVNGRLKDWEGDYDTFKYSYARSIKAAFEKECKNFHDFGGDKKLDNENHPARPKDTDWKCPECSHFD